MRKSASTIVGFGILTALFLAMMSMFYLQHLPNKQDLKRLESDLRREFGLYLAASAPIEMTLIAPEGAEEGDGRLGVELICTMRSNLQRRPTTVGLYLDRMATSVVTHPDFRGKIAWAKVSHTAPVALSRTRKSADKPLASQP